MKDEVLRFLRFFEDDVMVSELLSLITNDDININKLLKNDKLNNDKL